MPKTTKSKVKSSKKKATGKNGSVAVAEVAEEEEPKSETSPEGLDALVGLIDHDAEAEEHALSNGTKEDDADFSALKKVFDDVVKIEDARAALQWTEIECPHCGEAFQMGVDPDDDGQDLVEDCRICCRPIQMTIEMDGEDASVSVFRE
ncbi:MAG: hypothetical protein COB53_01685 [Elusimicrobia bacterium]|nr:MAG: hypothetical protein COB53_01685 [Elusimicrobiota bacterium]